MQSKGSRGSKFLSHHGINLPGTLPLHSTLHVLVATLFVFTRVISTRPCSLGEVGKAVWERQCVATMQPLPWLACFSIQELQVYFQLSARNGGGSRMETAGMKEKAGAAGKQFEWGAPCLMQRPQMHFSPPPHPRPRPPPLSPPRKSVTLWLSRALLSL